MQPDELAQIRSTLMTELDWPATAGEVEAVAERSIDDDRVAKAATRLPDRGTWLEIDELWADLDPLLEDVVHNP